MSLNSETIYTNLDYATPEEIAAAQVEEESYFALFR